jgi:hypothetical protein
MLNVQPHAQSEFSLVFGLILLSTAVEFDSHIIYQRDLVGRENTYADYHVSYFLPLESWSEFDHFTNLSSIIQSRHD